MFYRASPVSEIIDHFIGPDFVDSFLQTFGLRNRVTLINDFSFVWILFGYPIWTNNLQSLPGNLRKLIDNFWGFVALNHRVRINVKNWSSFSLIDIHYIYPSSL